MNLGLEHGDRTTAVRVEPEGSGYRVTVGEHVHHVEGEVGRTMRVRIDARPVEASVRRHGDLIEVELKGRIYAFRPRDPRAPRLGVRAGRAGAAGGRVHAPMPGLVVEVLAKVGDSVEAGRPVVVVEAMKMQNALSAPVSGRVASIHVSAGATVETGQLLMAIDGSAEAS